MNKEDYLEGLDDKSENAFIMGVLKNKQTEVEIDDGSINGDNNGSN